jgi:two-component sensor histidine kinase
MKIQSGPSASRHLAEVLRTLESATTRDAVLAAIAAAAQRAVDSYAVLAIRGEGSEVEVVAEGDAVARPATFEGPLKQSLAASEPGNVCVYEMPEGAQVVGPAEAIRVRKLAVVPVSPQCGCTAIGFLWSDDVEPDVEAIGVLSVLASAAALSLRARLEGERARRQIDRVRHQQFELQHRLRNVLAFVRSIVRRTMQSAESSEEFALHLEARIAALSRIYSTLSIAAAVGVEIEDLVRAELRANAVRDDRFEIRGPSIRLKARAAETMALALHELATNSLKFGSLSQPGGCTAITWQTDSDQPVARLRFLWLETGVRVSGNAPRRRGFGQELIENTLPYELDAQTRFELTPVGLRCAVDLPLDHRSTPDANP